MTIKNNDNNNVSAGEQLSYNEYCKLKMREYRKTAAYREYLERTKEQRNENKRRQRARKKAEQEQAERGDE